MMNLSATPGARVLIAALLATTATAAHAAPMTTLDRNGSYVVDRALCAQTSSASRSRRPQEDSDAPPGYGITAKPTMPPAGRISSDADGDIFASARLTVTVDAAALAQGADADGALFRPSRCRRWRSRSRTAPTASPCAA